MIMAREDLLFLSHEHLGAVSRSRLARKPRTLVVGLIGLVHRARQPETRRGRCVRRGP
jgi:hypothetical protein